MRTYSLFLLCFSFSVLGTFFATTTNSYAESAIDRCPRHDVQTELIAKRAKTKFLKGSLKGINDFVRVHNGTVLAFVQNPLSVKYEYKNLGNGRACVMLDKVQARFWAAPRIVMPTDFKKGSCEYKIILKHEKRHLQAAYDFHDRSTIKYRSFLGRIARNVPIFPPVTSSEQAAAVEMKIADYFAKEFYAQVEKSYEELNKIQSKIDSPQEYLFNTTRKLNRCAEQEKEDAQQNSKLFYDRED